MTPRAYVDTSAYLAIILGEQGYKSVLDAIHAKELCSSTLLLLESERNIVRMSRECLIEQDDYEQLRKQIQSDREAFILRDLTPDLCLQYIFPAISTPRSADLVHLRTAAWFKSNGGLAIFVSLDSGQRRAASDMNFEVVP